MTYKLELLPSALKEWKKLGHTVREQIKKKLRERLEAPILEYMRRDLLNQILGNSDNHGRNTAILRTEHGIRLAPIYDLAPMVMDDEGVTRTTKWPKHIELAGEVNWRAACAEAAEWVCPEDLFQQLQASAQEFLALPDLLSDEGLPDATMNHPRIRLRDIGQFLGKWGLL